MAQFDQFPRPVMSRAAGFHSDQTMRQAREEPQQILATQGLGRNNAPNVIDGVNKKHMLRQIEANGRDGRIIDDNLRHLFIASCRMRFLS